MKICLSEIFVTFGGVWLGWGWLGWGGWSVNNITRKRFNEISFNFNDTSDVTQETIWDFLGMWKLIKLIDFSIYCIRVCDNVEHQGWKRVKIKWHFHNISFMKQLGRLFTWQDQKHLRFHVFMFTCQIMPRVIGNDYKQIDGVWHY